MRKIETEVLVIGGGATGAGVVRDAAMRGFKTAIVERSDWSTGTTGRYHGLLHSGGRYAVKDSEAAIECIEENKILRRIMPHCLEDTGGFFVVTPWDEPSFGLERMFPWLPQAQQLIREGSAVTFETLLMNILWRRLTMLADESMFGFEAVCSFVFRWDVINARLMYNADAAHKRFQELTKEVIQ